MGRRIYLSDAEVRVLNEALRKWENWSQDSIEPWEVEAMSKLDHKLYEHDEFVPPTQPIDQ